MKNTPTFLTYTIVVLIIGFASILLLKYNKVNDILPIVIEQNNHKKFIKSPLNFKDRNSAHSSFGILTFNSDTAFSFVYEKSQNKNTDATVAFFNLNKKNIDFSKYEKIEIGIRSKQTKRIALNLSFQNKENNPQYVQNFIDIKDGQETYVLDIATLTTPSSWYNKNQITQHGISAQDLSKIQAISFEGCQLLPPGIVDEFTIYKMVLKKDHKKYSIVIFASMSLLILIGWLRIYKPFKEEAKIIYIPIETKKTEEVEKIEPKIFQYLANNYSNADLKLHDLQMEFGRTTVEISKIIRDETRLTFPKYLRYLRITEAKRLLLKRGAMTISELGYSIGFNSPSNFIRVFKEEEGMAPKKYADTILHT